MEINLKMSVEESADAAHLPEEEVSFDPVPAIELAYENIRVNARTKQET